MTGHGPAGDGAGAERALRRLERALLAFSALLVLVALFAGAAHLTADALRH